MKYKNDLGQPITAQQMNTLDNYQVITFIDLQVKKIELFRKIRDKRKKVVSYFLETGEDKNRIIQEYSNPDENMQCILYFNKQSSGLFNLWNWEEYSSTGELKFKGQEVFDEKNRTIFYCSFNLDTNQLEPGSCKYYYGNKFEGDYEDILVYFTYHDDGELELIFDKYGNYGYSKSISLDTFLEDTEFSQVEFPWLDHPYYHSAYPFLPTGNL